ncbi:MULTISPECIES: hypothetical protein [unclassified Novosphingobium]|uniref:hypothetical protein n=1 Tax=unclassified Novosphingobium TaxID=2644732 RepID=UPI000D3232DB|nr:MULTISPECIES: hypothetical protein [unclassified Novosphingobium]PTR05685.1 hypothetical protein C8K11_12715 [Novosphingobium sp. GV055]PUA94253.1 hypothetical protein C8K12_12715 [Novosphingobium sp. GV061]PUB12356.1 hypothetical protein C8K14_12715 [Novosphingobium sp. GV079]PUB37270.1 hypothetical protein C8K10_12715 [Novosphingobium sp. GV027]
MGGNRIYKVGSPYNGEELAELDFEQTADTMYLAHIDHAPGKLVRAGHTDWSFQTVTFGPSIIAPASCTATAATPNTDSDNGGASYFPQPASYCVTAVNDDTGYESRASSEATVTNDLTLKRNFNTINWSAVAGATRYKVYKADNSQFFGYIGSTDSTTFRDDNIGPALDQAPPQGNNPFAAAGDYPSTVTLFEQRSMWARTSNVPHGVWGSRSGQLENMDRSRPAIASDALSFAIMAGRVNSVNHLVTTTSLLALTSDSVFHIDGDGSGGVLDATSPPATRRQIGRGSSRLPALVVDNVVFYQPSVGQSVRTIGYDFTIDGLKSNDVSIFSPHFFEGMSIVSWCYAQEPRSVIWAARDDGKLLCFTWEQEQNVWGWTLCETDGNVVSVCCISEDGEDRVYLMVDRQVQGVTRRFVERMVSHRWSDVKDCCFLDCAVSGSFDAEQTTFTGLWHLEGRTDVAGLVDGKAITGLTVTNGRLTLPDDFGGGKVASFGIPYEVTVETLPVRISTQDGGSNMGRVQALGEVVVRLSNTRQIKAGINEANLFPLKSRMGEAYGAPDALMNGEYTINMANKARDECVVLIRQTAPLPFTMLAIAQDPEIYG